MVNRIKSYRDGKVVVIQSDANTNTTTPLFCSCCNFPMKSPLDDAVSFQKHGVCSKCDNRWTNFPKVDWKKEDCHPKVVSPELWEEYTIERQLLSKPLITFK